MLVAKSMSSGSLHREPTALAAPLPLTVFGWPFEMGPDVFYPEDGLYPFLHSVHSYIYSVIHPHSRTSEMELQEFPTLSC